VLRELPHPSAFVGHLLLKEKGGGNLRVPHLSCFAGHPLLMERKSGASRVYLGVYGFDSIDL
jgi:hypothetical protein